MPPDRHDGQRIVPFAGRLPPPDSVSSRGIPFPVTHSMPPHLAAARSQPSSSQMAIPFKDTKHEAMHAAENSAAESMLGLSRSTEDADPSRHARSLPPPTQNLPSIKHLLALDQPEDVDFRSRLDASQPASADPAFPASGLSADRVREERFQPRFASQDKTLPRVAPLAPWPDDRSVVRAHPQQRSPAHHVVTISDPSPMFVTQALPIVDSPATPHRQISQAGDRSRKRFGNDPCTPDGGMTPAGAPSGRRRHTLGAMDEPPDLPSRVSAAPTLVATHDGPAVPTPRRGPYDTPRAVVTAAATTHGDRMPNQIASPTAFSNARRAASDARAEQLHRQRYDSGSREHMGYPTSAPQLPHHLDRSRISSLESKPSSVPFRHHPQGYGSSSSTWSSSRSDVVSPFGGPSGLHSRSSTQESFELPGMHASVGKQPPNVYMEGGQDRRHDESASRSAALRPPEPARDAQRARHQSMWAPQGWPEGAMAMGEDLRSGVPRPRAQTMTTSGRPIAPLPSSSAHQQHRLPHTSAQFEFPERGGWAANQSMRGPQEQEYSPHHSSADPPFSMDVDHPRTIPRGMHRSYSQDLRHTAQMHSHPGHGAVAVRRPDSSGGLSSSSSAGRMPAAPGGTIAPGTLKYMCVWCFKRFSRPSSLRIHEHSHTGEKPFVCKEVGCGRCFSVHSNLRRHQKAHHAASEKNGDGKAGASQRPPSASQHALPFAAQQQGVYMTRPDAAHRVQTSVEQAPFALATHRAHPPLSRSAYEQGSRASLAAQHWPGAAGYGRQVSSRERNLSGSSGEGDEDSDRQRYRPLGESLTHSAKPTPSFSAPLPTGRPDHPNPDSSVAPAFFPARISSRPQAAQMQQTPLQALSPEAVSDGETETAASPAPSDRTLTSRREASTGAMRHSFATLLNDPGH